MTQSADFLVVGAGMAGATIAAQLVRHGSVIVLEAEAQPGYHTTGRSAAFYAESYGGPHIRPLTSGSKPFLLDVPEDFSETPLVTPRGALHVFTPGEEDRAHAHARELARSLNGVEVIGMKDAQALCPILRPDKIAGAIVDPDCQDMDVAGLHAGYLRQIRRNGGWIVSGASVRDAVRSGSSWLVKAGGETYQAGQVINAAGAWGDDLAAIFGARPVGLTPCRRTIILVPDEERQLPETAPLVVDFDEEFYFKPETGRILASPADETPSPPCDAQPDDYDVAVIADRLQSMTTVTVTRIESRWAGLRVFAPDRVPVFGPDPEVKGFFWFVGQGGYGIQTAPAAGRLGAALVTGQRVPEDLLALNLKPEAYDPARFHV